MALGHVAAVDAVDLERHHRAVEQGDDALERPHPAQGAGAPAHRLGPGEAADDLIDGLGEDLGRLTALVADLGEPDAVALDQLVLGQAGLAQEAFQRLSRGRDRRSPGSGGADPQRRSAPPSSGRRPSDGPTPCVPGRARRPAAYGRGFLRRRFRGEAGASGGRALVFDLGQCAGFAEVADAADIALAFGYRDNATGIHQIENMRGLDAPGHRRAGPAADPVAPSWSGNARPRAPCPRSGASARRRHSRGNWLRTAGARSQGRPRRSHPQQSGYHAGQYQCQSLSASRDTAPAGSAGLASAIPDTGSNAAYGSGFHRSGRLSDGVTAAHRQHSTALAPERAKWWTDAAYPPLLPCRKAAKLRSPGRPSICAGSGSGPGRIGVRSSRRLGARAGNSTGRGISQQAGPHPPAGALQRDRRVFRRRRIVEQAEDRRARARHPRQATARRGVHGGQRLAYARRDAQGGRLQIIALGLQPVDHGGGRPVGGGVRAVGAACGRIVIGAVDRPRRRRQTGVEQDRVQRRQARLVAQVVAPARRPGRAGAQAHGTVGPDHARDGFQRRLEAACPASPPPAAPRCRPPRPGPAVREGSDCRPRPPACRRTGRGREPTGRRLRAARRGRRHRRRPSGWPAGGSRHRPRIRLRNARAGVVGRFLTQLVAQLGLDLGLALGLDLQRQDAVPLEARLALTPHGPVGVAEVVVDLGVGGLLGHGLFQVIDRLVELAAMILGPAQRVLDIAVRRIGGERPRDHLGPLLDPHAAVDPEVAKVVEHGRIVGLLLQRSPQLGLGLRLAVQRLIGGAAQEVHLETLIRDVEQGAVQHRQSLVEAFHLHQLTGQQIGDAGLMRARLGGAAQLGERRLGLTVLLEAERALHPGGGVDLHVLTPHLGQGRARRRLQFGLLQGLSDEEAVLVRRLKVQGQPQIDDAELQRALGDDLIGRGLHRQRRALTQGRSRRRTALGQHASAGRHRRPFGRAGRDGGVILNQSLVALAAPLQKLAVGQAEQARGQGVAGQVAPLGVGLVIAAAQLQQPGAVGAGHQGADRVQIGRRQGQGAIPVARSRRDPRLDIEAGAGVRLADGRGLQHGVRLARIAVDEGLHRRDQTSGLNDDGRDALPLRRDAGGDVEVARQQRGGEGLFAHAGLFGGQGLDTVQIVGARLALAAGQGVAARQVVAVGAAAFGVGRDRGPDRRDRRLLGRLGRVGDDDFGVLALGVGAFGVGRGRFGPPPPSGVTQVMFCEGSLMSQVLQCTQFWALIWKRGSAVFLAEHLVYAGRAVALRRQLQVGRLVLGVVGVGDEDRRQLVERQLAVRLGIGDRLEVLGQTGRCRVRLGVLHGPEEGEAAGQVIDPHVEHADRAAHHGAQLGQHGLGVTDDL
uniref:Transposase n=1 Tax=Parastrongyloides trichosuri TaxID=131310 RepID=A0A0N4ZZV5_PARTI